MAGASDDSNDSRHPGEIVMHASCVAIDGQGLLISGASGSGKSALALELMALGAVLVSDDRVLLNRIENDLVASAPAPIAGLIEARGIGLLKARPHGPVNVVCVVDLDRTETDRLPVQRQLTLLGRYVTLLFKVETRHFPSALMQFVKEGRQPE